MPLPRPPRIALIGAGPAGLTLGLLLSRHNIPFTIYELRPRPTDSDFAQPSGMLDLHEESGLAALKACGLLDEFRTLSGECSESDIVADRDGTVLHADEGDGQRPEISRHALMKMLLSHVPGDRIRWEHKLEAASFAPGNGEEIHLDFGTRHGTVIADIVIGADGAWSRVRPLVTDVRPEYSGVHFITLNMAEGLEERHPHLARLIGSGTFNACGDRKVIASQRGAGGAARIYLEVYTLDENYATTSGLAGVTPAEAKNLLLSNTDAAGGGDGDADAKPFDSFGPTLRELIAQACEEDGSNKLDVRGLYMLPVDKLAWQHRTGVTLIGDAAHLMTPYAGEGVNLAMRDALDLGNTIATAWGKTQERKEEGEDKELRAKALLDVLDPLMEAFEAGMVESAGETAVETWNNLKMFFSENAAVDLATMFSTFRDDAQQQKDGQEPAR